jgi:hypothetical protein
MNWSRKVSWTGHTAWKKLRDYRKFESRTLKNTGPISVRGLVIGRGRNTESDFKK